MPDNPGHRDHPRRVRAAAIQLEGVPGRVDLTLSRLESMIIEAGQRGAKVIAVPEFCTSPVPMRPEVHAAVLPPGNAAVEMFGRLAARYGATIGGSMLVADDAPAGHAAPGAGVAAGQPEQPRKDKDRDDDDTTAYREIYNRYHLVEPGGRIHTHDKDLPTMWENCFYTGGDASGGDDGAFDTALGGVGVASCWELIRHQTVARLRGRIDLAMTGTHWWTVPDNWGGLTSRALAPLARRNREMSENAPREFARRLGVPVLQASHCGQIRSDLLLVPGSSLAVPYETEFVGATQIVDASGTVLVSRNTGEGPGIVYADVELADAATGRRESSSHAGGNFWIPELPLLMRGYWHQQNLAGRSYYRRSGRRAGLRAASGAR